MVHLLEIDEPPKLTFGLACARVFGALMLAAPGAALMALYARRIVAFRADPTSAPGTPAETWIALMVMGVSYIAIWMSLSALRGRVNKPSGAAGFMCLAMVVAVIGGVFVRVP